MEAHNCDPKEQFFKMTQGMSEQEFVKEFGPIVRLSELIKETKKDEPA